jgi:hypothetical protein
MRVLLEILYHTTRPNDHSLLDWQELQSQFVDWMKDNTGE